MDRSPTTGNARGRLAVLAITAIVAALLAPLAASPAGAEPVPPIPAVTYTPGNIHGQNGWTVTGGYDQAVVVNTSAPTSFNEQSWRFSNSAISGSFGDQPFSPSVPNEAGEASAESGGLSGGTRQSTFVAEWDFASAQPSAEQPGLGITVSPDRGDGARMSWVRMEDTPAGLRVLFFDFQNALGCDDGFVQTEVVSGLDRTTAHHIRIEMDFVDGPENDIVRVFVDGSPTPSHTGTSWEDYFRNCEPGTVNTRTVDSLLFRSSGTAAPANAGKGLLFDNVAISTGAGSEFSTGFEPVVTSSSTTTVVTGLGSNWFPADTRPGGQLQFDEIYGGSLGDGAALLSTDASGSAKVQLFTDLYGAGAGTPLANVDAISYATYRDSAPPASPAFPALNLRVDADADDVVDTYLVYEPYLNPGSPADDVWQTWNAIRDGAGLWWASHPAAIPGCGMATPCAWEDIVAAHPAARVLEDPDSPINSLSAPAGPLNGSLGINLGSGNPSVVAAADALAVTVDGDRQIFDFEALFAPDAPTDLTATPDGDGDVDLGWTAPADDGGRPVTTYHVYRDGSEIGTTADTTFTDDTVPASSNPYAYTVTAENAVGEGDPSNTANATVHLFWKGFEWSVLNGSAEVIADEAVLTRFGPGESWIRMVGEPPVNTNGTPWIEFSYEDDGDLWQGVDMFIDSMVPVPNPRLQVGSLFTEEILLYARYGPGGAAAIEQIVYPPLGPPDLSSPRTAGEHTIHVGETADGRIDYQADGTWYSTTFLQGNGAPFDFKDVILRSRCNPSAAVTWERVCTGGEVTTFTDFAVGDDHDDDGPAITITTPDEDAIYAVDEDVTADYGCTDQSDIVLCDGPVADGADIDTSTPGSYSFTVDAEDEVGNTSSVTHHYTVLDVTDPTVTITTPEDGAFYYQGEHVVADYLCEEEAEPGSSDLASCVGTVDDGDVVDTSVPGPHPFTVTAEDGDGNQTELTHTYTVDVTDPTITITTPADGGTYDRGSPVPAEFECLDTGGSGVASCFGTVPSGVNIDTTDLGQFNFFVLALDDVGNLAVQVHTYTVVDGTDPTVTLTSPTDGAGYQIDAVVEADYSCADEPGGSGLVSCVGTVASGDPIDTSTLGPHTFTVTATDDAGNETEVEVTYTVEAITDLTDPTATITSPPAGAVYGQSQFVIADYACADTGGSGLASCVGPVDDGDPVNTAAPGEHDFTVTATDNDGNEFEVTNTYTVDASGPEITITTPADGGEYAQGSTTAADYGCTDVGGSTVALCFGPVPAGVNIDSSTLGAHNFSVFAMDEVGNISVLVHTYTVVDGTDPTVEISTPPHGATYTIGDVVEADYSCADEDGGSGLESCVGPVPSGDPIDTSTPGEHEFTVTATDEAGNEAELTNSYTVEAITDFTDPTATISSPVDGAVYYQGQFVTADYVCEDEVGGSGVDSCEGPVADGSAVDTAAPGEHEFTVTATDDAGNEFEVTHTYTVDASGPTVTITEPADAGEYDRGSNLTADYECDDTGGAEVASCFGSLPDGVDISTSTLGEYSFFVISQDTVGNLTVVVHTYEVVDGTPPTATITSPADGATYQVGQVATIDFGCADEDGGSGLASCVGSDPDGDPIDTTVTGDFELTVTAMDNDGNTTVVTHDYSVVARPLCLGESVTVDLALGESPTSGPDVIQGTAAADTIGALGGNDRVCSLGGVDVVNLGAGDDTASGGSRADQLNGGDGNDHLIGNNNYDVLRGNAGDDRLLGANGRDQLLGGPGADRLVGGAHLDDCNGGTEVDTGQQCEVKSNIP